MVGRYVVGFDFGTTYSGVAYARRSHPDIISLVYSWPRADLASQPYCKTTTSLLYVKNFMGNWECKEWGWPAQVAFCENSLKGKSGETYRLIQKFKLLLAEDTGEGDVATSDTLPGKISADMAITEFFKGMAAFTLAELRKNYGDVQMSDIEWALTVPAIWSDRAKQRMRTIALNAGMNSEISGPVRIILEPEAAAAYCHHEEILRLKLGDRFLILDAGGGTVDIAVHEISGSGSEVKEVARSEGGLYGATSIDIAFFNHLQKRIPCLTDVIGRHPDLTMTLMKKWDDLKRSFRGDQTVCFFEVPSKILEAWKKIDPQQVSAEIELSLATMRGIMDPVINKILELTRIQIAAAQGCRAILLVGGFAESHYLYIRVRETFLTDVPCIVKPPSPGSAICQGAVLEVLHPNRVISRISRKTYGMKTTTAFLPYVHPKNKRYVAKDKQVYCTDIFDVFVKNAETVNVNSTITRIYTPVDWKQRYMHIEIYSTTSETPTYTDEPGVILEGRFTVDLQDNARCPNKQVEVCMWFGRSTIEVKAERLNFGNRQQTMPIKFAAD